MGIFMGPNSENATMDNMGRAIFIPAIGFRFNDGSLLGNIYNDTVNAYTPDRGEYWSSTIYWYTQSDLDFFYPEPYPYVRFFYFSVNFVLSYAETYKNCGLSIRPVRDIKP